MKFFSKFLVVGLALTMFSCSSDEPATGGGNGNDTDNNQNVFYSSVKFTFPKTRSTGSEGEEIGKDYENNVSSILVVLTTKNATSGEYEFLSYALNDASVSSNPDNSYTITFQDKETLFNQAGNDVYIFAYCNPTEQIRNTVGALEVGDTFTDEICSVDPYSTWNKNGFLMTSVDIVKNSLPDEAKLKTYNTPGNAYPLGSIPVIRTMSRFDFRDASKNKDLSYEIMNHENNKVQGTVTFTRVALFNLADKFYYLPRTKAAGATSFTLCPTFAGMESGFVVSPDGRNHTEKRPALIDPLNIGTELKWASLPAILNEEEDTDNDWNDGSNENWQNYHIWRYATENTFAEGEDADAAKTTGYVFEAEIKVDENFGNVVNNKAGNMYLYGQTLYPNATAIYNEITKFPISTLATAFNQGFDVTKDENGNVTAVTPKDGADLDKLGFTTYKPNTDGKYFCYYFAYNVHNDDEDVTTVGPMEFATVRNNVYKLAVTGVKRFGTFTPPAVDEWDVYFNLKVEVKPWVVRVNNIEF